MLRRGSAAHLAAVGLALALAACTRVGPPVATAAPVTSGAPATQAEPTPITIAPVTGIPGDDRFSLESLLKQYAASRKFTVVDADDPTAVYHLKARFSALSTASTEVLVYSWDVTDAAGRRILHFSGQQTGNGTDTDPWTQVTGTENRLSVGMSKKPWICPAWRSRVSTRSAPARTMRLATSLAEIGVRAEGLRSWRA